MYGSRPPLQRTTWRRSNDPGTSQRLEMSGVFFFSWLSGFFCQGWRTCAVATFRWKFRFFCGTIKVTLPEFKITPENRPSQRKVGFPSIFRGDLLILGKAKTHPIFHLDLFDESIPVILDGAEEDEIFKKFFLVMPHWDVTGILQKRMLCSFLLHLGKQLGEDVVEEVTGYQRCWYCWGRGGRCG